MSEEQSTSSRSASALPACVEKARSRAKALLDAVLGSRYPAMDPAPSSDAEVARRIEQAIAWGREVDSFYGRARGTHPDPRGLCALFWRPTRIRGTAHIQGDQRLTVDLGSLASHLPVSRRTIELKARLAPLPVLIQWEPRRPSLDNAGDVLGELPEEFHVSLASLYSDLDQELAMASQPEASAGPLRPTTANWPVLVSHLGAVHAVLNAKALSLVAWVNERISSLEEALLPRIEWVCDVGTRNSTWKILLAGIEDQAQLTTAEADLLVALATDCRAETLFRTKKALLKKVPHLRPLIRTIPCKERDPDNNLACFAVCPAAAQRIKCGQYSSHVRTTVRPTRRRKS